MNIESGVSPACGLKKQTQFGRPQIPVTVCTEWDYENELDWALSENKADQTGPEQRRMEPISKSRIGCRVDSRFRGNDKLGSP